MIAKLREISDFPIVGVGSSAGGVEAVTELLKHLPREPGIALILIQHLDPTRESHLKDLYSRLTHMQVSQITHGMKVEINNVYIVPPNASVAISNGVLQLRPRVDVHGVYLPIDEFLRSLAHDQGDRAIGVILSGTGSDGTLGLAEIKDYMGISFVQDEKTSKFDGMPHSAIIAGQVDFILPVQDIAKELLRIAQHAHIPALSSFEEKPEKEKKDLLSISATEVNLEKILGLFRGVSGLDFSGYKRTTILRRIDRRMTLLKLENIDAYVHYLKKHPDELKTLYHDLLIKVTSFFRNPETFDALKTDVFPALVQEPSRQKPIRIWVPGCSSGEEVYSLSICLLEYFGENIPDGSIRLFATDIDDKVLAKARYGSYLENIVADVSPERLQRSFTKMDNCYRASKKIRDMCTFAMHNVFKDPPFPNLDLISCRNLLIYFDSALQERVISLFHYALKSTGFLSLGVSETIGSSDNLFKIVNKKSKIYSKIHAGIRPKLFFSPPAHTVEERESVAQGQIIEGLIWRDADIQKEADRMVLDAYAPAGILVNDQLDILQLRGDLTRYLMLAPGKPSYNLFKMAREGLMVELRKAIDLAKKTQGPIRREGVRIRYDDKFLTVTLRVIPMKLPPPACSHCVVLFEEIGLSAQQSEIFAKEIEEDAAKILSNEEQLRKELDSTKEYLQAMSEKQQETNEELKSAHEEVLSSNEELQSTNEELETSKEELQSANEELCTVNQDLMQNIEQLNRVNSDLNNLFISSNLPIILVGADLRVRRYTSIAEKILKITSSDIGRTIGELNLSVPVQELESLITSVLNKDVPYEQELQDRSGRWYIMRIYPFKNEDQKLNGVVMYFIDIHSLKDVDRLTKTIHEVEEMRDYAQNIVETVRHPLIILDEKLCVESANQAFYKLFSTSLDETERHIFYELSNSEWNIPQLRERLDKLFTENIRVEDFEVEQTFKMLGKRTMLVNARQLERSGGKRLILLAIEDITASKKEKENVNNALVEKEILLKEIHHRVKNNLQIISSLLSLQAHSIQDPNVRKMFGECQHRIRSMAMVHEQLYRSKNLGSVDAKNYLENLLTQCRSSHAMKADIQTKIDVDAITFGIDTAIPYGLLVNEIVTNAIKHAFPERKKGEILVSLREKNNVITLIIKDDGIGLPQTIDMTEINTLGLSLVTSLVDQLNGELTVERGHGTVFRIIFPLPRSEARIEQR